MKKSAAVSIFLILTAGLVIGYNEWHDRANDSRTALSQYYAEPDSLRERIDLFQLRMHDRMLELDDEFDQLERDAEVQHVFAQDTFSTRQLDQRFDHLEARIVWARWEGLLELEDATEDDWAIRKQQAIDLAAELEQKMRVLRGSVFPTGIATLNDRSGLYYRQMEEMGIPRK